MGVEGQSSIHNKLESTPVNEMKPSAEIGQSSHHTASVKRNIQTDDVSKAGEVDDGEVYSILNPYASSAANPNPNVMPSMARHLYPGAIVTPLNSQLPMGSIVPPLSEIPLPRFDELTGGDGKLSPIVDDPTPSNRSSTQKSTSLGASGSTTMTHRSNSSHSTPMAPFDLAHPYPATHTSRSDRGESESENGTDHYSNPDHGEMVRFHYN